MQAFWNELRRRHVIKVGVSYAIIAWVLIQVVAVVVPTFDAPHWVTQTVTFLLIIGFPLAVGLAWAFEVTLHEVFIGPRTGVRGIRIAFTHATQLGVGGNGTHDWIHTRFRNGTDRNAAVALDHRATGVIAVRRRIGIGLIHRAGKGQQCACATKEERSEQ